MRWTVGLVLAATFAAALVFTTLSENRVECEVCMRFGRREACRTVAAVARDYAVTMAVSNACGVLASGVTPGIQCSQTPPRSITCDE